MEPSNLRRQPTLPLVSPSDTPPRKILKAKRTLPRPSVAPDFLTPSVTPLIKPSLSKRGSSLKRGVAKGLSLKKDVSITKETDDIATAAVSLDSGSYIGKTGVITEADIPPNAEVTEVDGGSAFSSTGNAVVTSLRKSLSGSSTLSKRLSKKKSSVLPPLPPLPPGGLIEVAFSFDTTGSMSAALDEVKGRIKDIVLKLQSDVPGIRIAIFAHGDYCDKDKYIVKWIDFGASIPELHDFINSCEQTGGGDADECYELVLRRATEVLSWTPGSKRSLVIIGDNLPHEPGYTYGDFTNDIDWRQECVKLKEMGVKVYGVVYRGNPMVDFFYKSIAERTDGLMIPLEKFDLVFDLMMAICYREGGEDLLKAYQDELKEKYGVTKLNKSLSGMFAGLTGSSIPKHTPPAGPMLGGHTGLGISFPTTTPPGSLFGLGAGLRPPFPTTTPLGSPFGPLGGLKPINPTASPFGGRLGGPFPFGPTGSPFGTTMKASKAKKNVGKLTTAKSAKRNAKGKEPETQREKIGDKKFKKLKPINRLKWSPWKPVMNTGWGVGKDTKQVKWLMGYGYAVKEIFERDFYEAGVFEFALQPSGRTKKKYVVSFTVTNGLPAAAKWMQTLIRPKYLKTKFAQAMSQNASVFVRRGKFKSRNKKFMETVDNFLKKSNYAFGPSKRSCRDLKLKGLVLNA